MAQTAKELRKRKTTAEKLLKIKGIDYDAWLDEKHTQVIDEYQEDVLDTALKMLENKQKISSNTSPINNNTNN